MSESRLLQLGNTNKLKDSFGYLKSYYIHLQLCRTCMLSWTGFFKGEDDKKENKQTNEFAAQAPPLLFTAVSFPTPFFWRKHAQQIKSNCPKKAVCIPHV